MTCAKLQIDNTSGYSQTQGIECSMHVSSKTYPQPSCGLLWILILLIVIPLFFFLDSTQRRQRDTKSVVSSGYYSGVLSMTSTQSGVQARREHLTSKSMSF